MKVSFTHLIVAAAAIVALGATARPASALTNCTPVCDFTFNPNAIMGVVPGTTAVPADANPANLTYNATPDSQIGQDITGNYSEHLTLNVDGTWSAFGYIQFTSILAGSGVQDCFNCATGSALPSDFTGLNKIGGYVMYATFTASGTWEAPAPDTVKLNVGDFGTPGLFVDMLLTGENNTYNAAAATVTTQGTDYQLLTASFLTGSGQSTYAGSNPNGSFDLTLQPTLTNTGLVSGDSFFTAPRPFHIRLDLSGQFLPANFDPTFGGFTKDSQTLTFTNVSADATFSPIPEPATMTLVGLGLVGIARSRRRRHQS